MGGQLRSILNIGWQIIAPTNIDAFFFLLCLNESQKGKRFERVKKDRVLKAQSWSGLLLSKCELGQGNSATIKEGVKMCVSLWRYVCATFFFTLKGKLKSKKKAVDCVSHNEANRGGLAGAQQTKTRKKKFYFLHALPCVSKKEKDFFCNIIMRNR